MSTFWDRDAARDVLAAKYGPNASDAQILDALEGCVRPAPRQTIDRDTLIWHIREVVRSPEEQYATSEEVADGILALLRPVDGVTLTHDEAAIAAYALRHSTDENGWNTPPMRALADRLEAAS